MATKKGPRTGPSTPANENRHVRLDELQAAIDERPALREALRAEQRQALIDFDEETDSLVQAHADAVEEDKRLDKERLNELEAEQREIYDREYLRDQTVDAVQQRALDSRTERKFLTGPRLLAGATLLAVTSAVGGAFLVSPRGEYNSGAAWAIDKLTNGEEDNVDEDSTRPETDDVSTPTNESDEETEQQVPTAGDRFRAMRETWRNRQQEAE